MRCLKKDIKKLNAWFALTAFVLVLFLVIAVTWSEILVLIKGITGITAFILIVFASQIRKEKNKGAAR